ncbi:MAG: alpha-2-macroglobulin family protein [Akkermansia sp.]|nr:alpha-2-macroglobulin family protein [Akkermansia sp.]
MAIGAAAVPLAQAVQVQPLSHLPGVAFVVALDDGEKLEDMNFHLARTGDERDTGEELTVEPLRAGDGVYRYGTSLTPEDYRGNKEYPRHYLVRGRSVPAGAARLLKTAPGVKRCHRNHYYYTGASGRCAGEAAVSQRELRTEVCQREAGALEVSFHCPVPREQVKQAFRNLQVSIGGCTSVNAEDGESKTVTTPEGTYEFRLERLYGHPDVPEIYDECSRMVIAMTAPHAVDMRFRFKAGTATRFGLALRHDHVHALSVAPETPWLRDIRSGDRSLTQILPLAGPHVIKLEVANGSHIRAEAAYWPVESASAPVLGLGPERMLVDGSKHLERRFTANVETWRWLRGLKNRAYVWYEWSRPSQWQWKRLAGQPWWLKELFGGEAASRLGRLWQVQREERLRLRQDAATQFFPAVEIPLQDSAGQEEERKELALDLDALTGGNTRPGIYRVHLELTPACLGREALALAGMPGEKLHYYATVQVSDLYCLHLNARGDGDNMLFVCDRTTGAPLRSGRVLATLQGIGGAPDVQREYPLENGLAVLDAPGEHGAGLKCVAVQGGEQSVLSLPVAGRWDDSGQVLRPERAQETVCTLFTDRRLYRPGETIRIRGYCRSCDTANRLSIPEPCKLKVVVAGRHETRELEAETDEYGAFTAEYTLPVEGRPAGTYNIYAEAPGDVPVEGKWQVQCQEFRRESFACSCGVRVDDYESGRVSLQVSAADYTGVPVAGGQVQGRARYGGMSARFSGTLGQDGRLDLPVQANLRNWAREGDEEIEVEIEGTVRDARGETRSFREAVVLPVAEFTMCVSRDCLLLEKPCPETGGRKPLDRKQKVRATLMAYDRGRWNSALVWQGTLKVPADCAGGLPLKTMRRLEKYNKKHGTDLHSPYWVFETPEGGSCSGQDYFGQNGRFSLKALPGRDSLELRSDYEGEATMVISCGRRKLRTLPLHVSRGVCVLAPALLPEETGRVDIAVYMALPPPAGSSRLHYRSCTAALDIPDPAADLAVQLDLPQDSCRPGAELSLGGRVLTPQGKPADAAVTFYAVDAGTLSAGGYALPQPRCGLCRRDRLYSIDGVQHQGYWCRALYGWTARSFLMRGLWQGDAVSGAGFFGEEDGCGLGKGGAAAGRGAAPGGTPPVREDFRPLAFWHANLCTDADGRFSTTVTLPDTLTAYRLFAVAADKGGNGFGTAEGKVVADLPVMLHITPPDTLVAGDELDLPVTLDNRSKTADTFTVRLEGMGAAQQKTLRLEAGKSGAVTFRLAPQQAGHVQLQCSATGTAGGDAMRAELEVVDPVEPMVQVMPAVLKGKKSAMEPWRLLSADIKKGKDGSMYAEFSASPLIHLQGFVDYALTYPYGCTEQRSTGLLPWLMYDVLAPFCPRMAETTPECVQKVVAETVEKLFSRQQPDGGLSYWDGGSQSCFWASAYAGMVLQIAVERGFPVPEDKMKALRAYLEKHKDEAPENTYYFPAYKTRYQCAYATGDAETCSRIAARHAKADADLACLATAPADRDKAFLKWCRDLGGTRASRCTTISSSWKMVVLHQCMKEAAAGGGAATLRVDGKEYVLDGGMTRIPLVGEGGSLSKYRGRIELLCGAAYGTVVARAVRPVSSLADGRQRSRSDAAQVGPICMKRRYTVVKPDGREVADAKLRVGDVVRVDIAVEMADTVKNRAYLAVEDFVPACMEVLNPNLKDQAAPYRSGNMEYWLDYKEYLPDRVRGFCDRGTTSGTMSYYARVRYAGSTTAPPAKAQLMYNPGVQGFAPARRVQSK